MGDIADMIMSDFYMNDECDYGFRSMEPVQLRFVEKVRETERGICLQMKSGGHGVWWPKRHVMLDEKNLVIVVPEWLCSAKSGELKEEEQMSLGSVLNRMTYPTSCTSQFCGKAEGYGCDETCRHWPVLQAWKQKQGEVQNGEPCPSCGGHGTALRLPGDVIANCIYCDGTGLYEPVRLDGPDRRYRKCLCSVCGEVHVCTPQNDFYSTSENSELLCEKCFRRKLR